MSITSSAMLLALASLLPCAACGPFGAQEGSDLIDGANKVYQTLPVYPGAVQTQRDSSTGTDDESGPVTSGTTLHVFRLPRGASVIAVERYFHVRLRALGWRVAERLPGLADKSAGPVINFARGPDRVSINLDGGYGHRLEVAVTERRPKPGSQ